jgi:hypothetical protein
MDTVVQDLVLVFWDGAIDTVVQDLVLVFWDGAIDTQPSASGARPGAGVLGCGASRA